MRTFGIVSLIAIIFSLVLWLYESPVIKSSELNAQKVENFATKSTTLTTKKSLNKPAKARKRVAKNDFNQLKTRTEYLLSCLESQTCDYPQTDPRSYDFALGDDMIKLLEQSKALFAKNELTLEQIRTLGHDYVMVPNGHVQAKAIEILEMLPTSTETFSKLESVFSNNFDSVLLTKSMSLLERYHQQSFSEAVDSLLLQQVQTGGHFVRQTLSAQVLPFINNTNVVRYQDAALALPPNSLESRQLNAVLEEYQQLQQGG